jgi:FKBP-type peptidyl-prolyl cis-trans isomerase
VSGADRRSGRGARSWRLALLLVPVLAWPGGAHAAPADVAAPGPESHSLPTGVATRRLRPGTGKRHPGDDDLVVLRFSSWRRNGQLFSTAEEPITQPVRDLMRGLREVVKAMVVGEQRRAWVPAGLAFEKDDDSRTSPPGDLTIDVELTDLRPAPPAPARLTPPARASRTASGVAWQVLSPGRGARPGARARVTLALSGWTAQGVLFESTARGGSPVEYVMDELMPGLHDAVAQLHQGEKARVWIPAALAYGMKPRRGAPAGPLVYDLELLRVEPLSP